MSPSAVPTSNPSSELSQDDIESHSFPYIKDVLVVGAGPAGLMLASNLVRYGIPTKIIDDRQDKTSTGRADGLQPKTIETFRQLRLAEELLRKGVKVYDICFWDSSPESPLRRSGRQIHYPGTVDTQDPYVLLVHQGMIEDVLERDLAARGVAVNRNVPFSSLTTTSKSIQTSFNSLKTSEGQSFTSSFVVGCDGAHSLVRKSIPSITMEGSSGRSAWGVLDGVLKTNFPDIWSKTSIHSHSSGAVLVIPRERNMTRLYIELHPGTTQPLPSHVATQEWVMSRAKEIMAPYTIEWESVEWFSVYKVGQRVASAFSDDSHRIFIAGDAAHTHSPKAAQGMNTSMHDAFNLSWKLALTSRGLASPSLIESYELERRQIAQELIDFDKEHAEAFENGDAAALQKNFEDNIAFISGVGIRYSEGILNKKHVGGKVMGALKEGALLPPARVQRYIDANPVEMQFDIPMLCQFRIFFFVTNVHSSLSFLNNVSAALESESSVLGRATRKASISYSEIPVKETDEDEYLQPSRYTTVSRLYTPALITSMDKEKIEIDDLPDVFKKSPWTFYIDNVGAAGSCAQKYLGGVKDGEVGIVNVRPDGYVGCVGRFSISERAETVKWLDEYYGGFLKS